MYSVVLMAALTAGADTPAFCHGWRCHGCSSCYGCTSCYSCSCWGCHGCHGARHHCGGWCHGNYQGWGCHGCYGCAGCYGGCYATYACHGCTGWASPYGVIVLPSTAREELKVPPKSEDKKDEKKESETSAAANTAKLVVQLPADAKLFIDDQLMKTSSDRRTFSTPTLEKGQLYYYILRAEIVRDGQVQTESKRVIVKAGQTIEASFPQLIAAAANTTAGTVAQK